MATLPVAGPWTKYAASQSAEGPWTKYAAAASSSTPQQTPEQQAASAQSQGLAPTGKAPVGVQMKQSLLAPVGGTFNPLAASDPDNPLTKFFNRPEVQAAMNVVGPTTAASDVAGVATKLPAAGRKASSLGNAALESVTGASDARQAFQELEGTLGQHTVAMTDELKTALDDLKEFTDVTGRNPPSVVTKLVTRMADTEQGPLTYKEARIAYSDLSDLSASDKMNANAKLSRLVIPVKQALGNAIGQTADAAGLLQKYQTAMKDFSQSQQMTEFGQKILKALAGAGISVGAYETIKNVLKK